MIVSPRSLSCAAVVIGLALRFAPGQANKQTGDAIGRARWESPLLRASWRGNLFEENRNRHKKGKRGSLTEP